MSLPIRTEAQLRHRQERGELTVRVAAEFRHLVEKAGLEEAYALTDVVVAADACFTDQASLHLSLGPTDPPIRLRSAQLAGVSAGCGHGSTDFMLPMGGALAEPARHGGAQVLGALLAGASVPLSALGDGTALHPRRELHTELSLERIAAGRLLLHRGISENGVVATSSAEGLSASPYGPLLGPFSTGLYSCGGAGSIGLTMPGLALLGPGSPVLVGGAVGWVVGSGSGHNPKVKRQSSGHALSPGCAAALSVDLHELQAQWVRPCFFEGHGSGLLVAIAAPVPLINESVARQAATGNDALEAPVLDLAIPRRLKPSLGKARYSDLLAGELHIKGRPISCAPAHSPRLAAAIGQELITRLTRGHFPLSLPLQPLNPRPTLVALEA